MHKTSAPRALWIQGTKPVTSSVPDPLVVELMGLGIDRMGQRLGLLLNATVNL